MERKNARVLIAINEGRFEIEGEQEFVEKHLEAFKEHFEKSFAKMVGNAKTVQAGGDKNGGQPPSDAQGLAGYENLFAVSEDGKVQILKTVPGSSGAEKSVNVALLLLFAKRKLGTNVVPFSEVQEACQSHACLDTSNFTSVMKGEKQDLLVSGKPRAYSLSLTVPGQQRASQFANSLNVPA